VFETGGLGQAEQDVHVLDCLPRGAFDQIVDRRDKNRLQRSMELVGPERMIRKRRNAVMVASLYVKTSKLPRDHRRAGPLPRTPLAENINANPREGQYGGRLG
jgi:hypothetical protein